jgi:hypothetical protein
MHTTYASAFSLLMVIGVVMGGKSLAVGWPEGQAVLSSSAVALSPPRVAETATALSEFEGRYKVGTTTCTVKPIKMAFEVRWAKGKGVMRFFFDKTTADGKAVFISEDSGKGTDKFVFDDNRYNSGRFLRADGRTFAVERVR